MSDGGLQTKLVSLHGDGCFLVQYGDPSPSALDPCGALDHGACGKVLAGFLAHAQRLVIEDNGGGIGHKSADVAKLVIGDRALVHRR